MGDLSFLFDRDRLGDRSFLFDRDRLGDRSFLFDRDRLGDWPFSAERDLFGDWPWRDDPCGSPDRDRRGERRGEATAAMATIQPPGHAENRDNSAAK